MGNAHQNILRCDICSLKRALEPAVRAGKERMRAGSQLREKIEISDLLSIEKRAHMGGVRAIKRALTVVGGPGELFGNEGMRLEFTEVRKNSPKGWVRENSEPSTASGP